MPTRKSKGPEFPSFYDAFVLMNRLKKAGVVRDWAVYGAGAFIFYEEPIETGDLDIMVLADTEQEYAAVFSAMGKAAKQVPGTMDFMVGDLVIQVFPSLISPLYKDGIEGAVHAEAWGEPIKIISKEHLIVMALIPFRPAKDWNRIITLLPKSDRQKVNSLLERFDTDGSLRKRLEKLTSRFDS